jgi:hypothetical protein
MHRRRIPNWIQLQLAGDLCLPLGLFLLLVKPGALFDGDNHISPPFVETPLVEVFDND